MPRTPFALLALAAVVAAAPAAPVPRDAQPVPYFPTTVGARWVFQAGDQDVVEVVTAAERAGGATAVSVGREAGGQVTPFQKVLVCRHGLYLAGGYPLGDRHGDLARPFTLLRLPARPGDTWEASWAGRGPFWEAAAVVRGPERVMVPAGTFDAIKVWQACLPDRCVAREATHWYAPGVGPVQRQVGGRVQALKSFTPGKG